MGRYSITYISPGGREWRLTDSEWVAGIRSGGVEGLVGDVQDVTQSPVGADGQVLEHQAPQPMEGNLSLHIRESGGRPADEVWADFRKDFSRTRRGTLRISSPTGTVSTQVRLATPLQPPEHDPAVDEVVLNVVVYLKSDRAGWWFPALVETGPGTVEVANPGDVTLYPTIQWDAPGEVTVPSGAKFTLPEVPSTRVAKLAHGGVGQVQSLDGVADKDTRRALAAFPSEGVPAGTNRTYIIPAGASLTWQVGVLDPWL